MSSDNTSDSKCVTTFHGLNKWYEHVVEKLGWVLLCSSSNEDRVKCYIHNIADLKKCINDRLSGMSSSDKQQDLNNMLVNLSKLEKIVSQHSQSASTTSATATTTISGSAPSQKGGAKRKKAKSKAKSKSKTKKTKSKSKSKKY